MNEQSNSFLQTVIKYEPLLAADVKTLLGELGWSTRAHKATYEENKYTLHFYSDGLDLNAKSKIELLLKEYLKNEFNSFSIYFERKDKPIPSNSIPITSSSNTHQHHNQNHRHHQQPQQPQPSGKKPISGVKRIVAVASGKGGVGKSTVSVNLAISLHQQGYRVGILDADVYGPSLPMMLGIYEDPQVNEQNKIIPPMAFGLKVMSFGFFAPAETAVIWRGPMIMKALQQFFWDVDWGALDFLIIDLPPGTGDAQLTLVQSIPLDGAVIVTTPQNVALLDAVKGIAMFRKTNVPILGVIENMSSFQCPTCHSETFIFGSGGAQSVSEKFEVPLLGHIPLVSEVRESGDAGEPIAQRLHHPLKIKFSEIAEKVVHYAVNGGREKSTPATSEQGMNPS
ncbi:MAG: Mrp/NBP35 family ATP-binding protein [Silvanigrellaceae bacterium]|nr:Mrp/NBP35 family ATP-binding protein [Silvanigrellaceae bacterium]